ncbi:hypothetical protein GUITHDRAFT_100707 [Guillardia theta CCMP2712]|uniref:Uncharacterized protein n=1 Tax=Guillardia theta (strain CCMP2712) TaxID=905079 RepID=L1JZK8_GUITC|nr:hypothetical protein GUITHDRAFT_100707 [Guillardia theta CCMP2712]EKX53739.1 hypothetical protein GUITHDRAFT_100707 [Guillardia theta CCMP2712]|eukprot:XP_005840719.1 hypothetical protein GUITHDRAFT_100707 [Guillardia theta CCMP2712]
MAFLPVNPIIMRVFPRHVHARAASMQNPSLPNEAGLQSVIEHFSSQRTAPPEVLARKRAATYQRLTMQLTLEALLSGARRMTPLRAQALLEPEDSSSSDFVESPEESSPEVSDSDGGNPSSGPDDRRGAGDSEASPSLTVTSGASGELDTTGAACLRGFALGLAMPRLASRCGLCACRNVDIAQRHRALSNDVREIPDEADGGRLDTGTRKSIIMRVFPRHVHARAASMQNPSLPNEAGLQSVIEHFSSQRTAPPEVLARKRAATYQRLTMQLTLEALLSGARRMTPLRAQALLEPEDSSSSDFVESPEESSPEVSDSDGGNPSSGPDDRRGAGDSEASPSLTVTSGASGELDTTGDPALFCLRTDIGFTGRRHTVHSEKLHKHTQNTSPKRTSTAGTQTRQRQPKREAAQTSSLRSYQCKGGPTSRPPSSPRTAQTLDRGFQGCGYRPSSCGGYLPSRTRIPHCIDDALKTSFVQHRPNRTSEVVMRRGKLGGSAFAGLEMMCSNGGIELALTSITFRRTLADRHAMEIAVELLVCAASRLGWRCRVWVPAVLVLLGLVFCV